MPLLVSKLTLPVTFSGCVPAIVTGNAAGAIYCDSVANRQSRTARGLKRPQAPRRVGEEAERFHYVCSVSKRLHHWRR